jgi:hypothetical protein
MIRWQRKSQPIFHLLKLDLQQGQRFCVVAADLLWWTRRPQKGRQQHHQQQPKETDQRD